MDPRTSLTPAEVAALERIAVDPLALDAKNDAEEFLTGFYPKTNGNVEAARTAINAYRSIEQRLRYTDLLRRELLIWFEDHEARCTNPNCGMPECYARLITMIKDELSAWNPSIAERSARNSMSADEASGLLALKNELLAALESLEDRIEQNSTDRTMALSEQIEETWAKQFYGKPDWILLLKGKLQDIALAKGLEAGFFDEFTMRAGAILDIGPKF